MIKGLMGRCLNHETTMERVRAKAEATEDKLSQLKNWKSTMEKKFDLSMKERKERKELEQRMEEMKKVLKSKDKKIKDLKG